ncbi:MAG: cupin domain-containing protein [Rhodospirillales bacterium]|nr:cupin domain-containing protein [Rhodospirillales bacterium]
MLTFDLIKEAEFDPKKHVEKILGDVAEGDITVACWEPGQTSPNHCHPWVTEMYFCIEGGGVMRTPEGQIDITPGSVVAHPPGELHEYENGPLRSLLFRVRYGGDKAARLLAWPSNPEFVQRDVDQEYYAENSRNQPSA